MNESITLFKNLDITSKRVLIREDLNVPINDGVVASDARLRAALPTIKYAIDQGSRVILMSHLGRPTEGKFESEFSLKPVADYLSDVLEQSVRLVKDWQSGVELSDGEVVLLENVRFNQGESDNNDELAKLYANLCDVFVMDAFGTAHRAQASTHGVAKFAPVVCAGPLLAAELEALGRALENPTRPVVAIVGGAKVSTKLTVLNSLMGKVDQLIVGGGIANTFLAASGVEVGKSLCEPDLMDEAKGLLERAQRSGVDIPLPSDLVVGTEFSKEAQASVVSVAGVNYEDMIFDVGPKSQESLASLLNGAGTIVWNGPVGVFEFDQFGEGTKALANAIANSEAFTIAGGGDTLAAIDKYGVSDQISYISTGGGAFLEFLEGKELPAVQVLKDRCQASD